MIINIADRQFVGSVQTRFVDTAWDGRESKAITVPITYADAIALFGNDAPWSVTVEMEDDNGSMRMVTLDMSEYAISGPITDNRDGTVTVRMGKYREEELLRIPLDSVPVNHTAAQNLRKFIEKSMRNIESDTEAVYYIYLHPAWENLAAEGAEAYNGMRFVYDDKLYKVITAHTFASHWVPGVGTESLYARIDETHAGTLEDPIPYEGNMALTEGLYYEQYGAVYLCNRSSGNPIHNSLFDLIGLYVEAVS